MFGLYSAFRLIDLFPVDLYLSSSKFLQSWYGRHRNPIHAHHVTQADDKSFINWQVLAMDKEKDKFWATVDDDSEGIFDCLGMFDE